MKNLRKKKVTDTELALLNELWKRGHATIRELTEVLYPEGMDSQYATVQKLLERLEAKRFVIRDRSRRAHEFKPSISKDDFIGSRLHVLADKLCGGSLTPLLTNLVQAGEISSEDIKNLRALAAELSREQKTR